MFILKRRSVVAIYVVCLVLMCIGTAFDLRISLALFDSSSLFGSFFAAFAIVPLMLCAWCGFALVLAATGDDQTRPRVPLAFACLVALGSCISLKETHEALPGLAGWLGIVVELVLVALVTWWVYVNADRSDRQRLLHIAMVMLLVTALSTVIIHVVKIPWGRPRFRSIIVTEGLEFRPWYVAGGSLSKLFEGILDHDEFRSFPSGHTGGAACVLTLPLLAYVVPQLREREGLLCVLSLAWCVAVMAARIVAGAHFLTDVTAGFLVSYTVLVVAHHFIVAREESKEPVKRGKHAA